MTLPTPTPAARDATPLGATPGFPPPASTPNPTPSAVDTAAKGHFSSAEPPITAPLSTDSLQVTAPLNTDSLQKKYLEAAHFLNDNKLESARALFNEIISALPSIETCWLFLAACKINSGYTYPESSAERQYFAKEAKEDLDLIYNKKSSWNDLSVEIKTDRYGEMKRLLEECQSMIPDAEASIKADIASKIKECDEQAGKPDSKKTPPRPEVPPIPENDSWKPVRIFAAFTIATAIIVGAAVLGRRFFTRLN